MQQCRKIASYRSWFWSSLAIQPNTDEPERLAQYVIVKTSPCTEICKARFLYLFLHLSYLSVDINNGIVFTPTDISI